MLLLYSLISTMFFTSTGRLFFISRLLVEYRLIDSSLSGDCAAANYHRRMAAHAHRRNFVCEDGDLKMVVTVKFEIHQAILSVTYLL